MEYLCIVVIEYFLGPLESASQWVQNFDDLRPLPALAPVQPTQHQVPQFLILIILKLIECIDDTHGSLEVMYPNLVINKFDEVWFEVGLPEVVLELEVECVPREVEGLDYLDGLDVGEGEFLACHLFDEKLDVLLAAKSDGCIEATEDGAHGVFASIPTNIRL